MKWTLYFLPIILFILTPACAPRQLDPDSPEVKKTSVKVKNKPYRVRGKRYTPMSVEKALLYTETGIASYYGGNRTKVRTASGERINARTSLTAAHRTLPIPSKVKVTCLATGKFVVVRINDRGPFHRNRVIDLTTAAAKKINLMGRGVGKVKLEVISVGDGEYEIFAD